MPDRKAVRRCVLRGLGITLFAFIVAFASLLGGAAAKRQTAELRLAARQPVAQRDAVTREEQALRQYYQLAVAVRKKEYARCELVIHDRDVPEDWIVTIEVDADADFNQAIEELKKALADIGPTELTVDAVSGTQETRYRLLYDRPVILSQRMVPTPATN